MPNYNQQLALLYAKENRTSLLLRTTPSMIRTRLIKYIRKEAGTKNIERAALKKALEDKASKGVIAITIRQGKRNAIYIRKQAASLLSIP